MNSTVIALWMASGILPWAVALWRNRRTTLFPALLWAGLAWAAWIGAAVNSGTAMNHVASSLTACSGVAVFGARRPGHAAWNFVVFGLGLVLLIPLAESVALGTTVTLGTTRTIFLTVLLGATLLNFLPTRSGLAAVLIAVGSAGLIISQAEPGTHWPLACIAAAPWAAALGLMTGRTTGEFDRKWRAFRDRFGMIWGLRLREQFNRVSANAGWPIELKWTGLSGHPTDEALAALRALMKRFGPADA